MSNSRGPHTLIGALVVAFGAIVCTVSLFITGDSRSESFWSNLQAGTKFFAVTFLLASIVFSILSLAVAARWPRALAAVAAGVTCGWFAPVYGIYDGDTASIIAAVGSFLLLGGAVVLGLGATGAGEGQAPQTAWGAAPATYAPAAAAAQQPLLQQRPAAAAAGWYPDPQNAGSMRYWDGSIWTEHVQSY